MPALWSDPLAQYRNLAWQQILAQQLAQPNRLYAVVDPTTGASMEYRHLIRNASTKATWEHSCANEFGRLAQGIRDIVGTDTIRFIRKSQIPPGRRATYPRYVCEVRPQKSEPNRTRITVGGNLIDYPGEVATRTADLTSAKILWNSVISTPGAKFMCIDVKNFYLGTPLDRPEYLRFHLDFIPEEIKIAYNLYELADENGYVYAEINKGMYGLPQAGLLANKLLEKRLNTHGYYQHRHTPGLWAHRTRPVQFTLVVDDFGVKYVGNEHAEHLIKALQETYETSIDWSGSLYCGITLEWDYVKRTVDISMPGYVQAALHRFQHSPPPKPQHSPYPSAIPMYGAKIQYAEDPDTSPRLPKSAVTRIQQIIGTFLFYARAVDSTMLAALSTLSSEQASATENTEAAVQHFLNYCATHPDAKVRYVASDMILRIHSDASYLSERNARSRSGGHFYLGNATGKPNIHNGAILEKVEIIKHVMSSAAESETGALFINGKEAMPIRQTLLELNHPQPPTPLQTDNSTATGIVNKTVKLKRSKAMDMRFYWVQDRVDQKQLNVYWAPGSLNLGDYVTKHHPAPHHVKMRRYYTHQHDSPVLLPGTAYMALRGCVDPLKVLKDPLRESMPNTVIANSVLRESTDLNVDGTSRAIQSQHFTAHYSPKQSMLLDRLSS
jgi:hypothetical protein